MTIRSYVDADERGWVVCRVLSFLASAFHDDVRQAKERYENPAIELVAECDGEIVGLLDAECELEPRSVCDACADLDRAVANSGRPHSSAEALWRLIRRGAPGSPARASRTRSYTQTMKWRAMKWRAVGFVGVVLAAVLLLAYLDRYRDFVGTENVPPVLVAKQLIPKGTPGLIVATNGMYAATTLPPKEIEVGAVADPSYLKGRAAAVDILPGEQILASDFASVPSMTVLVATERIPKGTPGSIVVANGMYRATVPRPQQRQVGAISDPSYLMDRESVEDIQLGQQLTEANFPARG